VIDMYRQHIETPVSIPEDLKADMDFYNGSQRGRIYRIAPENDSPPFLLPKLSSKTSRELVDLLEHPNQWHRLMAQRLLLERQDTSAHQPLQNLFRQHDDPRTRLHALYTLEGLGLLTSSMVAVALADPHPGVREHGIILAERFPDLLPPLLKMTTDPEPRVALQACLSLGEFSGSKVISSLAEGMEKYGKDPWFRTALLSSDTGSSSDLIEQLINRQFFSGPLTEDKTALLKDIGKIIGKRNDEQELEHFLTQLRSMEPDTVLTGVIEALTVSQ
jgi:hypothetical protein